MTAKLVGSMSECIGDTFLLKLSDTLVPSGKSLLLKLEFLNPTHSIKDRTALGLVNAAFQSGRLKKGGMLIKSTSGNAGKSLAMLGAAFGFQVIVVVDPKVSPALLNCFKAYGARVELVTNCDNRGGYQLPRLARVKELLSQYPDAYWPNQYDNLDNQDFHYRTTAREICGVDFDSVIGAVSTGGHLSGVGRRIKELSPSKSVIACDIQGSAIFAKSFSPYLSNGVGFVRRVGNTDVSVLDGAYTLNDIEAFSICRLLAREHGILCGGSGGLVVGGALAWLMQSSAQKVIAFIPDCGTNYLDQIYNDAWLQANNISILDREQIATALSKKELNRQLD